jgi:serine/threonine protein kinase
MLFSEGKKIRDYAIVRPPWVNPEELFCPVNMGGMADSYMAADASGNTVFLKCYKCPAPTDPWIDAYAAYQRELKRIIDRNSELQTLTYRFIDFFREKVGSRLAGQEFYFQVFEFVANGKDLAAFLAEDTGYDGKKRTVFALLMMYAMSQFHKAGIVHGDLKPDNLFLFPSDCAMGYNLRIVDFDWSLIEGKAAPFKDEIGYPTTPGYSSPEHVNGERPIAASDVFTCGLMLYQLLTRDGNPYGGLEDAEYKAKALGLAAPEPALVVSHGEEADEAIKTYIRGCLIPDPGLRPTAQDVHRALLAWSKGTLKDAWPIPGDGRKKRESGTGTGGGGVPPPPPRNCLRLSAVADPGKVEEFRLGVDFGSRVALQLLPDSEAKFFGSRLFALVSESGKWFVRPDSSAKNATVLNGAQITDMAELHDGDTLAVGSRRDPSIVKGQMRVSI